MEVQKQKWDPIKVALQPLQRDPKLFVRFALYRSSEPAKLDLSGD